jgi:hypothetical protein
MAKVSGYEHCLLKVDIFLSAQPRIIRNHHLPRLFRVPGDRDRKEMSRGPILTRNDLHIRRSIAQVKWSQIFFQQVLYRRVNLVLIEDLVSDA